MSPTPTQDRDARHRCQAHGGLRERDSIDDRAERERAVVELALEGLGPLLGLDAHARAIAAELVDLPDVDRVSILGYGPGGWCSCWPPRGSRCPA